MRTFVAIDISPTSEIQNLLDDLNQNLKGIDLKYTGPANFHITLAFLGETTDLQIKSMCTELDAVAPGTIELTLSGLGVFKNSFNPQVLWIGMEAETNLTNLGERINQIISSQGFKMEKRDFSPHLTIGRVRKASINHNLQVFLKKYKRSFFGKFSLNEFIFYQSILTRQGPIYKPIKKFKLNPSY